MLAISGNARMKRRTKVIAWLIGSAVLIAFFGMVLLNYHSMKVPAPVFKVHRGEDRVSAVDRILEKLEFENIAFNAPRLMSPGDTAVIQLTLRLATPTDELKRVIEAEGGKVGARIRLSDRMEARLSGPDFAITAMVPEIQAVSRDRITECLFLVLTCLKMSGQTWARF